MVVARAAPRRARHERAAGCAPHAQARDRHGGGNGGRALVPVPAAPAWQRISHASGNSRLALVLSGHVHQRRQLEFHGIDHIWVPTTWAVLPDEVQPVLGAKRCGIVSLEFGGSAPPEPEFIEPPGITQLTIRDDLPDPYQGG